MMQKIQWLLLSLIFTILISCQPNEPFSPEATPRAILSINYLGDISRSEVNTISLIITEEIDTIYNETYSSSTVLDTLALTPKSTANIYISAYDSLNALIFEGDTTITVSDESPQTISIILTPVNRAPYFTEIGSTMNKTIPVEDHYLDTCLAVDPDGDSITFVALSNPLGVILNPTTGIVSKDLTEGDTGTFDMTVTVSDDAGLMDTISWTITVIGSGVNRSPEFTVNPDSMKSDGVVDSISYYEVSATDPDGDTLTYSAIERPVDGSFFIDPTSGKISWQPHSAQKDSTFTLSVKVEDPDGLSDTLTWSVTIADSGSGDTFAPEGMKLIQAESQSFQMGQEGLNGGLPTQAFPVSTISFTYDYYMDSTEVTQGAYSTVMTEAYGALFTTPDWLSNPDEVGETWPAFYVGWFDAALYCNALSKQDGLDTVYSYDSIGGNLGNGGTLHGLEKNLTQKGYRLPTEAEWEFACRAGTTEWYFWESGVADNYAWSSSNSEDKTHEVAQLAPNGFGLYDMSGNVREHCNDFYDYHTSDAKVDYIGPDISSTLDYHIDKGGDYGSDVSYIASASRYYHSMNQTLKNLGFRVVLPTETSQFASSENRAPNFISVPDSMKSTATVGEIYSDTCTAEDPEGGTLEYFLIQNPNGFGVSRSDGLILIWTPNEINIGEHTVSLGVKNTQGLQDTLTWTITVSERANQDAPDGMKLIQSGFFVDDVDTGWAGDTAYITHDFYMDSTEVTQADYDAVMSNSVYGYIALSTPYSNPSWTTAYGLGANYPAYYVNWFDVVLYCNARSKRDGKDTVYSYDSIIGIPGNDCDSLPGIVINYENNGYRLPTEDEWELAARANQQLMHPTDDGTVDSSKANYFLSNVGKTTEVGKINYTPNPNGLYNMAGNVWEWCNDWRNADSKRVNGRINFTGESKLNYRAFKGGSFRSSESTTRSAYRSGIYPNATYFDGGFRVVLPVR